MVPPDSHRVSRAPRYSGYHYQLRRLARTGLSPPMARLSSRFRFVARRMSWSYNPGTAETAPVWAAPISLATTLGITLVFSSSAYLDVSVQRVRPPCGVTGLQPAGLPHSDTHGSMLVCSSPWIFAAYRVLHRLWKPRHPPYALLLLVAPMDSAMDALVILKKFYSTSCFFFDFAPNGLNHPRSVPICQ